MLVLEFGHLVFEVVVFDFGVGPDEEGFFEEVEATLHEFFVVFFLAAVDGYLGEEGDEDFGLLLGLFGFVGVVEDELFGGFYLFFGWFYVFFFGFQFFF